MTEESKQPLFWSDQLAFGTTRKFDEEDEYVCAAGISPSGIVHAGNFREIITVDFVVKSLKKMDENVRFIYSWDDYDRFRKVPENVPDEFEKYIGLPLSKVPDPEGCHESYADHFESQLEEELEDMHMDIEFIRQTEMFEKAEYADLIKKSMNNRKKIKEILDQYRKEPLETPYYPLRVYCTECEKDFTEVEDYDGEYTVEYYCEECNETREMNFREEGNVKPPWRIDWPMRWHYEGVNFEPAGKEHSASGGSRDTANELVQEVFDDEYPVHQMYEFVTKDGSKISSSSGEDVFTVSMLKEIYSPAMIRFLFAGTKPNKAFEIPFETEEIFQRYENFDKIESAYYNPEEAQDDKQREQWKRIYELSMVEIPEEQPVRVPFKHASFVAQTIPEEQWAEKAIDSLKRTGHIPEDIDKTGVEQVLERLERAKNWARDYAPEEYRYSINFEVPAEIVDNLSGEQEEAVELLAERLEEESYGDSDELDSLIFDVKDESELGTGEFFSTVYQVMLSREQGPRLSTLIMSIGKEKSVEILGQVV
ncbi:MAG: lysyl-tRNA synthetase class 1 [Candidatus Nanohaloarchaea archaeon]|jgi:lysyl-tRNA synthetase class 1